MRVVITGASVNVGTALLRVLPASGRGANPRSVVALWWL